MQPYRDLAEPAGPTHAVLADRRAISPQIVFSGSQQTGAGAWIAVDGGAIVLAAAAGTVIAFATQLPASLLGAAAGLAVLAAMLADLLRTGRTPGHRVLGLRTVDGSTGLPPTAPAMARTRTVNIRTGRDPIGVTPMPHASTPANTEQWQQTVTGTFDAPIILTLDDGQAYTLIGPTVLGRNPTLTGGADHILQIADLSRTISKNHALAEPQGGALWLTDLGSMNGTSVAADGMPAQPVPAQIRTLVQLGSRLELGERTVIVSSATQPIAVEHPAIASTGRNGQDHEGAP